MADDTQFELNGRTFRTRPFHAREGSFIGFKVTGLVAPYLAGQPAGADASTAFMAALSTLPEADFLSLQDKCLRCVDEQLKAGWTAILHADGSFAVEGMEFDAGLVLSLTLEALMRNLSGFFGAGAPSSSPATPPDSSPPA